MSTTRTSPASSLYKGAIYLNNIGFALLEQGAFEDALETLRDAVHFQKTLYLNRQAKSLHAVQALLDAIQQANGRLASPQQSQIILDQHSQSQGDASTPPFSVLSPDDYRQFDFDVHTLEHPFHSFICPIRIEASDCRRFTNETTQSYDVHAAIMLHNLGLSHACLSKSQMIVHYREEFQVAAAKFFQLADSILQGWKKANKANGSESSHTMDCFDQDEQQVNLVRMAVLHSLYQVMAQTARFEERSCYDVLDRLYGTYQSVREQEERNLLFRKECMHAPAA